MAKKSLVKPESGYGVIGATVFFSVADIYRLKKMVANLQTTCVAGEVAIRDQKMKYNLLSVAALRELPAVIYNLREVTDNYGYFSNKSVNIVVNMAVSILDIAVDVMSPNGELVGAGTYIFRKTINRNISRSALYDFVLNIERIRKEIYADNADLLENK